MTPECRLWFVRHAEVEVRYHRIFGGRIDMGLSPTGQEQAAQLANFLHSIHFEAVYASPMIRVRQTLEPYVAKTSRNVEFIEGLREVDFGEWTGLGWEEVRQKHGISAFDWLDALTRGSMAGAESAEAFRQRVKEALDHIIHHSKGRQVAIFCHGGVIRMALSILLDLPLPKMAGFEIDYATATAVNYRPGKTEVVLLNHAPWRVWS